MNCNNVIDYVKGKHRMCAFYEHCSDCPFDYKVTGIACETAIEEAPEKAIKIVQKWNDEHPIKTRMSQLLELYPRAITNLAGNILTICPKDLDTDFKCPKHSVCIKCQEDFWKQEVE